MTHYPLFQLRIMYLLFAVFFMRLSCGITSKDQKEVPFSKTLTASAQGFEDALIADSLDCRAFLRARFPADSLKSVILDRLLAQGKWSENNSKFLYALKDMDQYTMAIEKPLTPVFRSSETEIGIFTFPPIEIKNGMGYRVGREMELYNTLDSLPFESIQHYSKVVFYPELMQAAYPGGERPETFIYLIDEMRSTEISNLGVYWDECLDFFEYSLDTSRISLMDSVLFSSPDPIDLIYERNLQLDSILKTEDPGTCMDCAQSFTHQRTFARLQGSDRLYFVYADTFPLNNQLDSPSRALIYWGNDNIPVYLWYEELDLFGCRCL